MFWYRSSTGAGIDFDDAHRVGCLPTWFIGFLVPAGLAGLGVWAIVSRQGWIVGRSDTLAISGTEAVMLGIALVSAALAIHARFVWTQTRGLWRVADGLLLVSMLSLCGSMLYLFWSVAARMMG